MTTLALQLERVDFNYGTVPVLEEINLGVAPGEQLGIIGPNGSGKSTLLRLILGLLQPKRGRIRIFGESIERVRHRVGYVPQHVGFRRDLNLSVLELVLTGCLPTGWRGGWYTRAERQAARETLEWVGLARAADRALAHLSGGELQRVLIARAFVGRPELLLLDEPAAHADVHGEERILAQIKERFPDMTILLVTHDIGFVATRIPRVACLNRRLICHDTSALNEAILQELYGMPLRLVRHDHVTQDTSA